ncbi:MAG: hypothetical protein HYS20_15485 [Rhodocyclales bacterium]|nr:hypothetical protein [Rhodocyclales bacterium]
MNTRIAPLLAALTLLSACATRPALVADDEAACLTLFAQVDAAVEQAGVRDAGSARVPGFPYLRMNRLLSDLRHDLPDAQAQRFWAEQLTVLDAQARNAELANLPPASRATLDSAKDTPALSETLRDCRARLLDADLARPSRLAALREAAIVPDDYSLARRTLGLYPLTRIPFAAGVREFERRIHALYAVPADALPVRGQLQRYAAEPGPQPESGEIATLIASASHNPLHIPLPDEPTLLRLARAYAPVYDVDSHTADDRIGHPYWPPLGPARIDAARAHVFYRAAHTRVGTQVLLQLVYTAWFPARPREGVFDLLGGHLDALIWRVTLAPDGAPLLFDSIHACGCYHWFFPTPRAVPRQRPAAMSVLDEWLFIPQSLPPAAPATGALLRVAAGSHYLQRVLPLLPDAVATARYTLTPESVLRSLPHPDGTPRSLYGPDGMVAGSQRRERWLFWPMGIVNPGAMRQWGRHPTAFVGRRHFDEARLIDSRFKVSD